MSWDILLSQTSCICTGKAGALIGALVIGYLFTSTKVALTTALAVLASTNFVGLLCCMFCPEAKQLPLELSCHTESWFGRVIGRRRGYTLQMYRDGAYYWKTGPMYIALCVRV